MNAKKTEKTKWYWGGVSSCFIGFTTNPPNSGGVGVWWGPHPTFTEAKMEALKYYRGIARTAHAIASDIKVELKP